MAKDKAPAAPAEQSSAPVPVQDPNVVPMRGLTAEVFNNLLKFLDTQPHSQVRSLIDSLHQTPLVNVTFEAPKKD